jgi:hypothetical protein
VNAGGTAAIVAIMAACMRTVPTYDDKRRKWKRRMSARARDRARNAARAN